MLRKTAASVRIASAVLLVGLLLGSVLLWFVVTQPLLTASEVLGVPHADPNRLEAHVRVLARGI